MVNKAALEVFIEYIWLVPVEGPLSIKLFETLAQALLEAQDVPIPYPVPVLVSSVLPAAAHLLQFCPGIKTPNVPPFTQSLVTIVNACALLVKVVGLPVV